MTTKCTGLWLPAKFGKSPHPECCGCVRNIAFKDPLSAEVKQAENDCATCSHQHDCLAHPAKPEPLTADEVWKSDAIMAVNASMDVKMNDLMKLVRAVEAAVWEKCRG